LKPPFADIKAIGVPEQLSDEENFGSIPDRRNFLIEKTSRRRKKKMVVSPG
jgi:hypothetical protein